MSDSKPVPGSLSKNTRFSMTLGMGLSACVCLLGAGGVAIKAKNDVEYANQRQDAEIANLKERIGDLRETVNEIRNDVKTLIRRSP